MALTRPRFGQLNTGVVSSTDPLTVLHAGSTLANVDVGFLMNRANGLVSNVALYWNESGNSFVTAFTSNTGITDTNVAVTSYANVTTGHHLPGANVTYSLGSTTQRWKDLWLSGSTIYLGGATISSPDPNTVVITNQNSGSFSVTGSAAGQASGTFGNLVANSGITSTNTSSGALQVVGGAGITGNLNIGGITSHAGNVSFDGQQVTHYDSIIDIHTYGNLAAWVADDGKDIGIRMHYYKGSDKLAFFGWENTSETLQYLQNATETNSNVTGTLGNVQFGSLALGNTTTSTSTTTGALIVAGGAGIAGNVYIGGNLDVVGTTTFRNIENVTTTEYVNTINATNLYASTIGNTGSTLTGTLSTAAQPNITTLSGVTSIGASGSTTLTGTLQTAAQTNITSVGTLTSLSTTGNLTANGYGYFGGVFNETSTTGGVFAGNTGSGTPSPRIGLFNGTASQNWQIDNYGGTFRWFTPGVTRMQLDANGNLTVNGNLTQTGFHYITSNIAPAAIQVNGTGTKGGAGYLDFLLATNLGGGTNPNKYFRLDSAGTLQIINSAYTTNIFNLTDAGVLSIPQISAGGSTGTSGQVLSSTGSGLQWVASGGFSGGAVPNQTTFASNVVANSGTGSTGSTTGAIVVNGGIGVSGNVWAGQVYSTNNGNGTNFAVGDDSWIGDINVANTFGVKGQQDPTQGYIVFGNANNTNYIGRSGSNPITVTGAFNVTSDLTVSGNIYASYLNTVAATQLSVTAPLVYLTGNPYPYNYDIGTYSHFIGGPANVYAHTGVVRSYANNYWGFFSNVKAEPAGSVNWADAGLIWDKIKSGDHIIANTTVSTSTSTGALQVAGGAGIAGAVYAGSVYDNGVRVVSTSSGAGNLTISAGAITLPATGPGATTVGSSTSIPVITTDAYGRVGTLTTATVVAPAGTLTGTTLASGVTASSLTSVGTIISGTWSGLFGAVSGANLTSLTAGNLTGTIPSAVLGASTVYVGTTAIALNRASASQSLTGISIDGSAATVTGAAQTAITSVGTLTSLTVSGALSSGAHTITGSPLTAIVNGGTTGVGNIGAVGATFNTIFAKATTAQYADLAERYTSDAEYPPGTVVVFGGEKEITVSTTSHNTAVAGVISTDPAYLMNAECIGLPVALTGRVPCQVQGPVAKGAVLVTSTTPGVAQAIDNSKFLPGCVIGKALESINTNNIQTIEVVVGRF